MKSTKSLSFFFVVIVLSSFIVLVQCQFRKKGKQKSKGTTDESSVCQLEFDPGTCQESIRKFYFDANSGDCKIFWWTGCDGNANRFNSRRLCEKKCKAEKGTRRCPSLDCDDDHRCRFGRAIDANGCETCDCKTTPTCPQDRCFIQCPFGYAEDEHGCRLCECLPPTCAAVSCGIDCQHGFKNDSLGCKICECKEGRVTEKEVHVCSPVMCAMHCERGFVKDRHGCNVCQCVDGPPPPQMAATPRDKCGLRPMCAMHCPLGFQTDSLGCNVCRCVDGPPPPPPATTRAAPVDRCSLRPVCRMYCSDGFVKDADGCDRCECLRRPPPTPTPPPAAAARTTAAVASCPPKSWFWCLKICTHGHAKGPDGCDKCECYVPGETNEEEMKKEGDDGEDDEEERVETERQGWEMEPEEPELRRHCSPVQCRMYCKHGFQTDDDGCEICKCRQVAEEEEERQAAKVPSCSPITCYMYCQHGFEKDDRGCDRCRCAVPPPSTAPSSPLLHRTPADRRRKAEDDGETVDAFIADARKSTCSLSPEVGPCRATRERWHYNPRARRCETFTYGGCRGNANNFLSEKSCIKYCKPEVIQEPPNWKLRYLRMIGML